MYNRLSVGNGFLDVDNKAELQKLKEHESSLQRQASSIRQMISKIDDSFFAPLEEKKNRKGQLSLKIPSADVLSGWEESKRRSPPNSFSKSVVIEEEPQITDTQKYIQSLRAKRTSAVKERIHERAQMLEKMEDMRQHALVLARKKEAEALADNFYLHKVRLRALQRLQANANHKLRLSYAIIRSNLNRQRKSLQVMFEFLHQRCIIRTKGVVFELRVAWKRFADTIIPKIQNRDWLFVQHERAIFYHRRSEMHRLFLELANTKGKRSVMYKTAKQCHKRLMFKRFISSFRAWISKAQEHAVLADKVSKFCANKVDKGPSILVESCRLLYQTQRKHIIKTARIVGTPLLQFLFSTKCDILLQKARLLRKFTKLLLKKQALMTILERTKRQYYRQLSKRYVKYWRLFLSRRSWYENQPPSAEVKSASTIPRKQQNDIGGMNLLLKLDARAHEKCRKSKFVLENRIFYHRIIYSSVKQYFCRWVERSKEQAKRHKLTLPTIQQKLIDNLSLKMKFNKMNKSSSVSTLAGLHHLHRTWEIFQLSLQNRKQIRSLVLQSYGPMQNRIKSRIRVFFMRLRKSLQLRQKILIHWHKRSQALMKKYFLFTLERLRQHVRRQKLHRMGMRYFRQCIYARLLESMHRQLILHTRHTHTVKISPRNRRVVYLALQRLRERVVMKKKKIKLIRQMRGRIYSELMLKHLRLWSQHMKRLDVSNARYEKGREHFKMRQSKKFLVKWIDIVQDIYERRKRFQMAEKVTLPNLARFCLKEWKAVTENSLYYNVTQYQKGQLWWKTSLQYRYLRIWMDNAEEMHEWDDRMQHFQDHVQHPLRMKRALRIWQEYIMRRDRRRVYMSIGEAMAIRQEAKNLLVMWRYRVCEERKPFLEAYDNAREHYAHTALRKSLFSWQENTKAHVWNKISLRSAKKYFLQERQLRHLLLHWRDKTVSVYRRERRAKRLMRWYRHHRYWSRWSKNIEVLQTVRSRLKSNQAVVQNHRNKIFLAQKMTWFRKLRYRIEYQHQKKEAKVFRDKHVLQRVFVHGFKVILQQYHDAHANEMYRARIFALQRQQRQALFLWLSWKRFRCAQRRFVDHYRRQRLLKQSLIAQWNNVFVKQVLARKKMLLHKAKLCHKKLSFRRGLRRLQVFLQRRKQFLFKIIPPTSSLSNLSPKHAKVSSINSLLISYAELDQWQKQRASMVREKNNGNLRPITTNPTSTENVRRLRVNSRINYATSANSNKEDAQLLRHWMQANSLKSTREVARYLQQRVLLHRLLVSTWRALHVTSLRPQHSALQRSFLFHTHRCYLQTLTLWQERVSNARHLRRLTDVYATQYHDTVTQRTYIHHWREKSVSRLQERRVLTAAWMLSKYRLAWDTWRMRSNASGRGDIVWMDINNAAVNKGNNLTNLNEKLENENKINAIEGTTTNGIITMPIVKRLVLETSKSQPKQQQAQRSKTSTANRKSPSQAAMMVDAVNHSGILVVRLSHFYRLCLRLYPRKQSLHLAARHRQAENMQRAERFHLLRLLTLTIHHWQEHAQRGIFLHHVVSRRALHKTHQRALQQWRHWHVEHRRQEIEQVTIADHFHLHYRLHVQVLLRWRRFRHLSRAKRWTRKMIVQRRLWVTWRRCYQRHHTMRRILHWMTQKDRCQQLAAAWHEWVAETRVERSLATHLRTHQQHLCLIAWQHWRRHFHLLMKVRHRRNMAKAKRFFDIHRRSHVFACLLSSLERKYYQADWIKVAARFATQQSLKNTLTNLLALRRNRIAENFCKKHAFQRMRFVWQRQYLPWQKEVNRLQEHAKRLVVQRALSRWQQFVQLAFEKKYALGVLPKSLISNQHNNANNKNNITNKNYTTDDGKIKPPQPPPPPPRRTSSAQPDIKQHPKTHETTLSQFVQQEDTLRHYSVYFWQQRQSQVLRRLKHKGDQRHANRQLLAQCDQHHQYQLVYRAFHIRWLQDTVRRKQRLVKNRFVQARYDVFLRLSRALRIWDTWANLHPAWKETQLLQAKRMSKRLRMKRGFSTLRWFVHQLRDKRAAQLTQVKSSRRRWRGLVEENDDFNEDNRLNHHLEDDIHDHHIMMREIPLRSRSHSPGIY